LIEGYEDGTFQPNANITREQMAIMIMRALKLGGQEVEADASLLGTFADRSGISSWSEGVVAQTLAAGIIQGTSETTFAPQDDATRAQAATMLQRTLEALGFINS
jgi:nanoRNase/pAp phosphatase (c-di-AMP/oligoRNAs hydrolase)